MTKLTSLHLLLLAYHPMQGAHHVRFPIIFLLAYTPALLSQVHPVIDLTIPLSDSSGIGHWRAQ